jgi:ubiquinone/menaquinone biosynthesis C-methylase UbiE
MFEHRSYKPERIDLGDYTAEEYDRFLQDIRFVNRFAGDIRALKKTLLKEIKEKNLQSFSVLDVGAGSGELLRTIAGFARKQKRNADLFGLELNPRSAVAILKESKDFTEIRSVQGDALKLPFADKSFDYTICSLFSHHFPDEKIVDILGEMSRVARRKIFVIDLHRHLLAYLSYKIFGVVFRLSPLVRHDGALSILRSFKPNELKSLAEKAQLENVSVKRCFPFRLVLQGS